MVLKNISWFPMTLLDWFFCLLAVSIPLGVAIWTIFTSEIRPLLVPRAEIERLADEILNRFPADPVAAANGKEVDAWMRSDLFRMGLYRRVRLELARRQEGGSASA